jgi:drug/metabolite transporter (DMT)-like permease
MVSAHVDAFAMVLLRMGFGGAILAGWAAARGELRIARGQLGSVVAGALFLVVHFALWIKAFDLTDYASNLLLLASQPVIAALLGRWLGEKHGAAIWVSVALAIVGLAIIAGRDVALGGRALVGDALCILAGLAITLFYVVTRAARAATPIAAFMGVTFLLGAAAIAPVVWLTGASLALPAASWKWIALLVLVTTVGGHGLMNLAARQVSLFVLNVVIVLEPPLAIAIGAALFGARVTATAAVGGLFLVASVVIAVRAALKPPDVHRVQDAAVG